MGLRNKDTAGTFVHGRTHRCAPTVVQGLNLLYRLVWLPCRGAPACAPNSGKLLGCCLNEELATSSPPTAELPLKGKLEGVRSISNIISKLENAMKRSSQLRKRPLEGKLSRRD